ncbi:MAG: TlpA family protein disulfide reductase [Calditrichia bacterium]
MPERDFLQQQIVYGPDSIIVAIKKSVSENNTYSITVDEGNNGTLDDDKKMMLKIDSTIVFQVRRSWKNKTDKVLTYYLGYLTSVNKSAVKVSTFFWASHYRAEGKLLINGTEYLVAFLDSDGNGKFDKNDFRSMTSLQFDTNKDGKIWGKDEYFRGYQTLPFENQTFLLAELAVDGSYAVFERTDLIIPKVGEKIPGFELTTTGENVFSDESLLGENYLLDFWASWCAPCVAAFPELKQLETDYRDKLQLISINIDSAKRVNKAESIIEEYELPWPQVIRRKGSDDDLWKLYGGTAEARFGIPLYVVVDSNGVIQYLGKGGINQVELKAAVAALQIP